MLTYDLLPDYEGIVLYGDYSTLKASHAVTHDMNARSPLVRDQERDLLPFAYDLRKAFTGEREIIPPPDHQPLVGPRLGVKMLWPLVLIHARILRASLAWIDHGPGHQAAVYGIEAVLHDAIEEAFAGRAGEVSAAWQAVDPASPEVSAKLESRAAAFFSWRPALREASLADLLKSLQPAYEATPLLWEGKGEHLHPLRLDRAKF